MGFLIVDLTVGIITIGSAIIIYFGSPFFITFAITVIIWEHWFYKEDSKGK